MNNNHCRCKDKCICEPPPEPRVIYKQLSEEAFNRQANALARSFCPDIHECKKCGSPYIDGYCCDSCGDGCPELSEEQEAARDLKYAKNRNRSH